jgi:uncharacterized protein (DUF433 family)
MGTLTAAFTEIASDPAILGGKPCVRGTRISVEFILELLASGGNIEQIHEAYPEVSVEAARQAVMYASRFLDNEVLIAVAPAP